MSSGSLKDLSKAIYASASEFTLPLPDDLLQVISNYVAKHAEWEAAAAERLHEELTSIHQALIVDHPSRLAPFLELLRLLKNVLHGSKRILQWWDKLSGPVMVNLGVEKGLAIAAKESLLEILTFEDEEELDYRDEAEATSDAVAENLITTWLAKTKIATEEFNDHAKFVEKEVRLILFLFGKRRPQNFMRALNKYIVKKDTRIQALSLLCEFFRHQPPHLHKMLETPLFDNLLKCLQQDTSTRAISLGMTALIMFLPHIPISASDHLPALFNIYGRLLFWDRERENIDTHHPLAQSEENGQNPEKQESDGSWDKLSYLLESEDETVPELLHYFTFLYGLYPINFMSYIRKPQRYLRHANFPGADDLEIEPTEIRQRSEPFRQVHLLHPNFFMLTIESEITDNNRWIKSGSADVVAECMALYVPTDDGQGVSVRSRGPSKKLEQNSDIPDQPLLDQDATPFQSRHTSWRDTRSTMVASPDLSRYSELQRKTSQTSQSMPSIADSPSLQPFDRTDSPTIPPTMLPPINNQVAEILSSGRGNSIRGSLHQSLTNESVASLALSSNNHHDPIPVDNYLASLTRDIIPRSPSLRPTTYDRSLKVAYLQREIQLLRNDLNFERYLKQQHLSHIGQLRRKQIREARAEAETQNLINSNRQLKSKFAESQRQNLQLRKETEKSKSHSRNWEGDLSVKVRALREEQKKWNAEREELKRDLEIASENVRQLKQLVITSERNELSANQKSDSVQSSLDELLRLRTEVQTLTARVREYESQELQTHRAKESEENALRRVTLLEMELAARDEELEKSREAMDKEVEMYAVKASDGYAEEKKDKRGRLTQQMLDDALAASRKRVAEVTKAHSHLLKSYTALQSAYLDLKEQVEMMDAATGGEISLLSGGGASNVAGPSTSHSQYRPGSPSPSPSPRRQTWRTNKPNSDPGEGSSTITNSTSTTSTSTNTTRPPPTQPVIPISSTSYIRSPPPRIDTDRKESNGNGGAGGGADPTRSPTSASGGGHHFNYLHPFGGPMVSSVGTAAGKGMGMTTVEVGAGGGAGGGGGRVYGRG